MITTWKNRLATAGLEIPLGDFCWGTTLEDSTEASVNIDGEVVKRVSRSVDFKALGTTFTFDGRCDADSLFRCGMA